MEKSENPKKSRERMPKSLRVGNFKNIIMRKINYLLLMVVLSLIMFTGCGDKEIVSSPISISSLPKATITGYVTADLNLQTLGSELVPAGTKLLISIPYSSLNSLASIGTWQDTIKVDASGKYTAKVPTTTSGVSVIITPMSFEANQTQAFGYSVSSLPFRYSCLPLTVSVASLQTVNQDISYSGAILPQYARKVLFTGAVRAELDATNAGYEFAPNGTIVRFYNSSWKDSAIVNNGKFSVYVPYNISFTEAVNFTANKISILSTSTTSSINTSTTYFNYKTTATVPAQTVDINDYSSSFIVSGTDASVDPLSIFAVNYSFTVQADFDLTNNTPSTTYDPIPDGTTFYFWSGSSSISSATWAKTVQVSGGKISISLPASSTVYSAFTATQKTSTGNILKTYNNSFNTISAPNTTQVLTTQTYY